MKRLANTPCTRQAASFCAPCAQRAQRARSGFTLVETLLALVILVVLTGIVAMGVPVAFDTYKKAVDGSNAQVLLTTTSTVLRDELGLSPQIAIQDGQIYYVSGDGYWASLESTSEGIVKHVYQGTEPGEGEPDNSPVMLVSAAAQTDSLRVVYDSIDYADGVFTVEGLKVVSAADASAVYADLGEQANGRYEIRALMLEETEEGR